MVWLAPVLVAKTKFLPPDIFPMYESHLHVQMQLKKGNSSKRRSGPADEAQADGVVGKKKLVILTSPNIIIVSKLKVFLSTVFFFLIHSSLIRVLNGWCQLTGILIVKWQEPMLGPNENLRPGPHKIQPAIIHNGHNKIRPSSITFAYAQENSTYFLLFPFRIKITLYL